MSRPQNKCYSIVVPPTYRTRTLHSHRTIVKHSFMATHVNRHSMPIKKNKTSKTDRSEDEDENVSTTADSSDSLAMQRASSDSPDIKRDRVGTVSSRSTSSTQGLVSGNTNLQLSTVCEWIIKHASDLHVQRALRAAFTWANHRDSRTRHANLDARGIRPGASVVWRGRINKHGRISTFHGQIVAVTKRNVTVHCPAAVNGWTKDKTYVVADTFLKIEKRA